MPSSRRYAVRRYPRSQIAHCSFRRGREARLFAVRERRANLHADRATVERRGDLLGLGVSPGKPERQSKFAEDCEIGHVAVSVDRLTEVVQGHLPARRGIVAAGRRAFNDETVDAAARFSHQRGRQNM